MKTNKFRDTVIGCLLVISLGFTTFFVSCSEEDSILTAPGPTATGNPLAPAGFFTELVTGLFTAVGEGAASAVGGEIAGWVLGAMGLTSSSSEYTQQLVQIEAKLDSIVTLINGVNDNLTLIEQVLAQINCSQQQSSLQTEIGSLTSLYNQYNSMLATAESGDTIPQSIMKDWADQVLAKNLYAGNTSVEALISTIQVNVNSSTGALYSCIKTVSLPSSNAPMLDTLYYANVYALANYYYYYQSIGLLMLSEAYHYYAWMEAGSPGANDTLTADKVQQVCNYNGTTLDYCNNVATATNSLYNSLVTQITYAGAPYSNAYYTMQYDATSPVVWVTSLEDFTTESGAQCPGAFPLGNDYPCGPTAGFVNTALTIDTYRGSEGAFAFAKTQELVNLFDIDKVGTVGGDLGQYLQDVAGFQNVLSPNKTVIASDSVAIDLPHAGHTLYFVPFFNTNGTLTENVSGEKTAVFYREGDFQSLLNPVDVEHTQCGNPNQGTLGTYTLYNYTYNNNTLGQQYYNLDYNWMTGFAISAECNSMNDGYLFFTDDSFILGTPPVYPGFYTLAQRLQDVPERFLWPVFHPQNATCTNGRTVKNPGGMYTMCNDDFTAFINTVVPPPVTCNNATIDPPCTTLQ
ncbi:MAG: hypothetical protein KDC73_04610 [Ignavibacteriae bacterium]|nr:hypothetical protein [Ignavibacteriota bacterium]MCB9243997.1 hypothetical protein [Ignavibacteriales bacterium]